MGGIAEVAVEGVGADRLEELLVWRERVLREVFELPDDADLAGLMDANRRYYARALAEGTHEACFAMVGREVVGCGGVCYQDEMPSPDNPSGTCAYLMNVYVDSERRGCGAGAAIVDWLVAQARERGCGKVYLESTAMAAPLYRKFGFVPLDGMMRLAI